MKDESSGNSFYEIDYGDFHQTCDGRTGYVVVVKLTRFPDSREEFERFYERLTDMYHHPYVLAADAPNLRMIINTSKVEGVSNASYLGSTTSAWIKANLDNAKRHLIESRLVIPNVFVRNILKVVLSLVRPASPVRVCDGMDRAIAGLHLAHQVKTRT